MRKARFGCLALAAALAGCEGTWATPSSFSIPALHGSQESGVAIVSMRCITSTNGGRCTESGSFVEVQFQRLHDAARYNALLEGGSCKRPGPTLQRVPLYAGSDRDGLLGFAEVRIPIHRFLKDGYAAVLRDRRTRGPVACGDLTSDRPW